MTETAPEEKVVISTETASVDEKIAQKKIIVYETRVDPTVIKVAGEKIKTRLFTRYGFLRPKPKEIQLISIQKYYEPYSIISGRYSIDYYRKRTFSISVDKEVQEVVLLKKKLQPERSTDSSHRTGTIELEGEERLKRNVKASLILDQSGEDVTLEKLPSAPSERHPKRILEEFGMEEIAENVDLNALRSRIAPRPKDISRLVAELFEVDERAVIYTPRFKVQFKDLTTGKEKVVVFDGVTSERIRHSKLKRPHDNPSIQPPSPAQP